MKSTEIRHFIACDAPHCPVSIDGDEVPPFQGWLTLEEDWHRDDQTNEYHFCSKQCLYDFIDSVIQLSPKEGWPYSTAQESAEKSP